MGIARRTAPYSAFNVSDDKRRLNLEALKEASTASQFISIRPHCNCTTSVLSGRNNPVIRMRFS